MAAPLWYAILFSRPAIINLEITALDVGLGKSQDTPAQKVESPDIYGRLSENKGQFGLFGQNGYFQTEWFHPSSEGPVI